VSVFYIETLLPYIGLLVFSCC